ncbi:hypothetical protein BDN72DRAFT_782099, partial [Pluteus cervinus]
LVNEVTTLRRHLEAFHKDQYLKWAKANNFSSMLPKCRKAEAEKAASAKLQTRLDDHAKPGQEKPKVVSYTDKAFREAATEWLIATNQPIQALENPHFIHMINVASRATNGVKIPGRKATRDEIINMFNSQIQHLKSRLNVRFPFFH